MLTHGATDKEASLLAEIDDFAPQIPEEAKRFIARRFAALGLDRLPEVLSPKGLCMGVLHYATESLWHTLWVSGFAEGTPDPNLGFGNPTRRFFAFAPRDYLPFLAKCYGTGVYYSVLDYPTNDERKHKGASHGKSRPRRPRRDASRAVAV